MPRLSDQERRRREAAYQTWVKNNLNFAATSVATGVEEKELHRWDRINHWTERWIAEAKRLRALLDEVENLQPMFSKEGINVAGQRLHVSTEMQIEAAMRVVDIVLEVGGEPAEAFRATMRGMVPDNLAVLARCALGVDGQGNPADIDAEVKEFSARALIDRGLATPHEIKKLDLSHLISRINERLRERGFNTAPQA